MEQWTIARVKAELPDVPFRQKISARGYNVGTGQLAGRKETFATLFIRTPDGVRGVEFAWQTIADCLNNSRYATI